jgi:hypothetical protein
VLAVGERHGTPDLAEALLSFGCLTVGRGAVLSGRSTFLRFGRSGDDGFTRVLSNIETPERSGDVRARSETPDDHNITADEVLWTNVDARLKDLSWERP